MCFCPIPEFRRFGPSIPELMCFLLVPLGSRAHSCRILGSYPILEILLVELSLGTYKHALVGSKDMTHELEIPGSCPCMMTSPCQLIL